MCIPVRIKQSKKVIKESFIDSTYKKKTNEERGLVLVSLVSVKNVILKIEDMPYVLKMVSL